MAKGDNRMGSLGFESKLWDAADLLRSNMDPAEYKHEAQQLELTELLEDRDEFVSENVFWVPPEARWSHIRAHAKQPDIGKIIDDAMDAIERENPTLKGVLPKIYAMPGLDKHNLGKLIDLISGIGLGSAEHQARDTLGRVHEYFLSKFASAEGKGGGEFYTPSSIVRVLVAMLEPYLGRALDPCCGSGGMFVQSLKFIQAHNGRRDQVTIYGQDSNHTTWRMARMNLAIELDDSVHDTPERKSKDQRRDAYLTTLGLKVLRFPNTQLLNNPEDVLTQIANHCTDSPSPSGRGVGGEGEQSSEPQGRSTVHRCPQAGTHGNLRTQGAR